MFNIDIVVFDIECLYLVFNGKGVSDLTIIDNMSCRDITSWYYIDVIGIGWTHRKKSCMWLVQPLDMSGWAYADSQAWGTEVREVGTGPHLVVYGLTKMICTSFLKFSFSISMVDTGLSRSLSLCITQFKEN